MNSSWIIAGLDYSNGKYLVRIREQITIVIVITVKRTAWLISDLYEVKANHLGIGD